MKKGNYISELIVIKGRVYIVHFYVQPDILDRGEGFTEMQAWDPFFEVEGQLGLVFRFKGKVGRNDAGHPTKPVSPSSLMPRKSIRFEIEPIQNR